jgi:hypothetical protein
MKKNKTTISLVARLIGGTLFLTVFLFNIGAFVKKDVNGVSVETLRAYANDGENGNEESVPKDYESALDVTTTETSSVIVNGKTCTKTRTCHEFSCVGVGIVDCSNLADYCEEWSDPICTD